MIALILVDQRNKSFQSVFKHDVAQMAATQQWRNGLIMCAVIPSQ